MRIVVAMFVVGTVVLGCSDDGVYDPVEVEPDAGDVDAAQAIDAKDAGTP